jgi:hypothetical protein
MLLDTVLLEPEQIELLCKFIEAERDVPKGQRGKFVALQYQGDTSDMFIYNNKVGINITGSVTDAEILAEKGLLGLSFGSDGSPQFHVRPEGLQYYRELKKASLPAETVEKEVRGHLSSDEFKRKYQVSFQKWSQTESLLWESDSEKQFTTIGHLCREVLQEFADILVNLFELTDVNSTKAYTISRIRSVLRKNRDRLGSTENEFLEQLIQYWEAVSNLIQRQEHGGQREGIPLKWEDARRVVFQTLIVMYEIDRSLEKLK